MKRAFGHFLGSYFMIIRDLTIPVINELGKVLFFGALCVF